MQIKKQNHELFYRDNIGIIIRNSKIVTNQRRKIRKTENHGKFLELLRWLDKKKRKSEVLISDELLNTQTKHN